MRSTFTLAVTALCADFGSLFEQPGILTRDLLIQYTSDWKGERFADGRPKVPDDILLAHEEGHARRSVGGGARRRMSIISMKTAGCPIHPDKVLVGRALTAQWLPQPARHSEDHRTAR